MAGQSRPWIIVLFLLLLVLLAIVTSCRARQTPGRCSRAWDDEEEPVVRGYNAYGNYYERYADGSYYYHNQDGSRYYKCSDGSYAFASSSSDGDDADIEPPQLD